MTLVERPQRPGLAAAATETATCPICATTGAHRRVRLREMMFGTREAFDYLLCDGCGTIRIAEVPLDLGRHYPSRYHYERLDQDMLPGPDLQRRFVGIGVRPDFTGSGWWAARVARRLVPPPAGYRRWRASFVRWGVRSFDGGVLDVGCGAIPNRLVALRALGFSRLLGIDPFIEHDTSVEGVPVRKMGIERLHTRFDLIWFHHSLERVPDPPAALHAAARLLRPGGRVVVRTPVIGTALWERYGTDWWELDPPRHLFVFSAPALEAMAVAAGLELEETVQETHPKEFIGSEQYRRDLAMFEPDSWFEDQAGSWVGDADLVRFADDARRANETGQAGRACFRFRARGRPATAP
jgi:SAM-dependent methyltransferase